MGGGKGRTARYVFLYFCWRKFLLTLPVRVVVSAACYMFYRAVRNR